MYLIIKADPYEINDGNIKDCPHDPLRGSLEPTVDPSQDKHQRETRAQLLPNVRGTDQPFSRKGSTKICLRCFEPVDPLRKISRHNHLSCKKPCAICRHRCVTGDLRDVHKGQPCDSSALGHDLFRDTEDRVARGKAKNLADNKRQ